MKHEIVILHESDDIQIYKCKCCKHYNVNYRNLFLTFTKREIRGFLKVLKSLDTHHYNQIHPEGPKAVISNSKYMGGSGFTQDETCQFVAHLEQAMLMEEVNESLAQTKN